MEEVEDCLMQRKSLYNAYLLINMLVIPNYSVLDRHMDGFSLLRKSR